MKKTFITNLILVLALNLSIKPFWILGIDVKVQNLVGTAEFGTYAGILSWSYVFCILLDLGITNFNNRNISQNTHLLTKHFSRVVILKLTLALLYVAVCSVAGWAFGYDARRMRLLLVLCFMQFLISFILYLRSNISGMHLFRTDSLLSATDRIIGIAICAPILWAHFFVQKMDIMDYVYIQTTAYFLTACIAFTIVVRKAGFIKFEWTRTFSMMILKKSFPFAILVMLMSFYNRIDQAMLERMGNDGGIQAGVYVKAQRLLESTNMIAFLAAGLLLPMFSRMLKFKESVESMVKISYTLLFALAIIIACGCCFYAEDIMRMLYVGDILRTVHIPFLGDVSEPAETAMVFRILMCCFMGTATQYIFGTLLTANGNLKYLNIIAGSGMLLNILLNLILIPRFHAVGSAIAALTTQLFVPGIQVFVVQRMFKFQMLSKLIFSILVFAAGEFGIAYFCHRLPVDWKFSFVAMVAASGIWILAVGLISPKSILALVKNRGN